MPNSKPSVLPDVHYGQADRKPLDWRKHQHWLDLLDDDSELAKTPDHVVGILGFDPLEKDEGEE